MTCDRCRVALADVAAGAPGPRGFEKHLGECAGCRAALANERRIVGRIDAELETALRISPSPDFARRARQRAAERASARRPWPLLKWFVPAAVGVVMLVLGIQVMQRHDAPAPVPGRATVQTPSPTAPREESLAQKPAQEAAPEPRQSVQKMRTVEPRTPRRAEPEVLLPPGEERAYLKFAQALQERRVDRRSLMAAGLGSGEMKDVEVPAVEIRPVMIEPIARSEP